MDGLTFSGEAKKLVLLLKMLSRRLFHGDRSVTDAQLMADVYGGAPSSGGHEEVRAWAELLTRAAHEHWEPTKLQAAVAAASTGLPKEHVTAVVVYWTNERDRIHAEVLRRSRFNHEHQQLAWRVDLKAASRQVPDVNEPVAVFEFRSKPPPPSPSSARTPGQQQQATAAPAQFSMDRAQLDQMLKALDDVKKAMEAAGSV